MEAAYPKLAALLDETPAAASARERSAFDEFANGRRKVAIFGAGRLGQKLRSGLEGTDLEVVAFADNNRKLWGKVQAGLSVLSPQDAAHRYASEATFVVAVWHPSTKPLIASLLGQLRALGCRATGFPVLFWRHPEMFLPYFFWERPSQLLRYRPDILGGFNLLGEPASRQTFLAQMRLRLWADFDAPGVPEAGEQYFPGLFSLLPDECFVDCGAYTGDTIESFVHETGGKFRKVIAFEADPAVLPALGIIAGTVGKRVALRTAVVGGQSGSVTFASDASGSGRVTDGPGVTVPCVRLDEALAGEAVSFIKMDIEGAELQALDGARDTIRKCRPVLAICGYHAPDHLWRVLASLKSLAPDSTLFLRSHRADGLDTVCYAVPPERLASAGSAGIRRIDPGKQARSATRGSSL